MLLNFHTHTKYCDGTSSIHDLVKAGLNLYITQLGISSHAPLPFPAAWSITDEHQIQKYRSDIQDIRGRYKDKIEIFAGIEADYIPGMTEDFTRIREKYNLDYIIGAVHLVKIPDSENVWFIDGKRNFFDEGLKNFFYGNGKLAAMTYFQQIKGMIQTQKFDIIAHFDKIKMNNEGRYFSESEPWYVHEICDILDLLKEYDIIMEVNTRGFYQNKTTGMYPSEWIIQWAVEKGLRIMVNSDAHKPEELTAGFDEAKGILKRYGYMKQIVRCNGSWQEI